MFQTRITELLGIKYPIIQGGMHWVARAQLAAAVSNAGGLGIIASLTQPTIEDLVAEIKKVRDMTDKPFGVNVTFIPTLRPINYDEYIDTIIREGVKIVETAGRNPEPYMARFKAAGVKVIHKCTSLRHALTAESIGVDALTVEGFECAGHPGEDDVTSLVIIPIVVDAVKVPVIASGGFADARGLVIALAMGAEGMNMGTRFFASQEAPAHDKVKEWLLKATERDTTLVMRSLRNSERVLKNEFAAKVIEMEKRGAPLEELAPFITGKRGQHLLASGDLEYGLQTASQAVGLVHEILPVKDIIESIIAGAGEIIQKRLSNLAR